MLTSAYRMPPSSCQLCSASQGSARRAVSGLRRRCAWTLFACHCFVIYTKSLAINPVLSKPPARPDAGTRSTMRPTGLWCRFAPSDVKRLGSNLYHSGCTRSPGPADSHRQYRMILDHSEDNPGGLPRSRNSKSQSARQRALMKVT